MLESEKMELNKKVDSQEKKLIEMNSDINQKSDFEKNKLLQQNDIFKSENIRFSEKIGELELQLEKLKANNKRNLLELENKNKKIIEEAGED